MMAVLPPIPQCVASMADLKTQSIVLSGKERIIRSFLQREEERNGPFEIALSPDDDAGNATAILRFGINAPYRAIGGLIYYAHMAKLQVVGWTFQPPLCRADNMRP
jgi:hypothetical protein